MSRGYSFHALAEQELNDAAQHYGRIHSELGAAFLDEIEKSITSILELPEASPMVSGNVRRKLLRRFPYGLLFVAHPDGVRVLAVMHLKRRPFYWIDRT